MSALRGISLKKLAAPLLLAAACVLACALLPSCAKPKPDNRAALQLKSSPEGATVTVFGQELGVTPWANKVPPGTYVFKFEKLNCKPLWEKVALQPGSSKTVEVRLEPVTAAVMIASVPSGVKVEFNGEQVGETPLVLKDVPIGQHSALLKRSGYVTKSVEWSVEDDARPKLLKVEMSSNVGALRVDSSPTGANLFIDGDPRGHTPFNDRLEQGQHKIRIEKDGYAVFEQLATVNRDKTTSVSATLQVLPGSLKITSSPSGATVFLGDKQFENTPTEIKDLAPGQYKIALEKAGHDRAVSDVTVRAGQKLEIDINLDSNTGGLDLVANPPGVSVYVDGRLVGATETDPNTPGFSKVFSVRNLSAGQHTVMIAHRRAIPDKKSLEVTVKKGKVERLPVITLWIANATMKIRGGPTYTGKLVSENENEVLFEPEPGIRQAFKRSEIIMLKPLKEQE
jgi:hypothetical protein